MLLPILGRKHKGRFFMFVDVGKIRISDISDVLLPRMGKTVEPDGALEKARRI